MPNPATGSPSMRAAAIGHHDGAAAAEKTAAELDNGNWLPELPIEGMLAEAGLPPFGTSDEGDEQIAVAIDHYLSAAAFGFWTVMRAAAEKRLAEMS